MRSRFLTVAATLAGLWASIAWAASDEVPPSGGTEFTLAPSGAAPAPPAGIFDPAFRPGNLAVMFWDPPASTIPFHFAAEGITLTGLAAQISPSAETFTLDTGAGGLSLRDMMVSVALAPGLDFNLAAGRDLAALDAFGGSAVAYGDPLSALRSPYLSVTDGGFYAGVTMHLAEDLQLRIGHAVLGTQAEAREGLLAHPGLSSLPPELALRLAGGHSADMTAIGLNWNFADWGTLGLAASHANESGGLFGDMTPSSITIASASETAALGISARVGFGGGWVTTIAYNEGVAQLDLRPKGFAPDPDTVTTTSYGITFAKQGLFGDDTLGLSLSQSSGNGGLLAGTGVDGAGNLASDARSLLGGAPESDIELGYITSFLGGSLALQANAAYQVHAGGQKGQSAVSVVSRAKINF